MQIALCRFVGKPTTITCIRDDGSITWQTYGPHSDFFAIHDLTHYAVETELGYKHGFFGMIAQGRDINDFGPGSAASLHPEAFHAEMLAGLLSTAEGNGARLTYEEIKSTIDQHTSEKGIAPIELAGDQLDKIRRRITDLVKQWRLQNFDRPMLLEFRLND